MISLDTFRSIANNSKIGKNESLMFKDDDKTVICGINGHKYQFKAVTDIDRQQNSIYMRSSLLSGIRDNLGLSDDSAAFKKFERLIFGDLVDGQFDAAFASKPLVKREIKAVLNELDAVTRERYKTEQFVLANGADYAKHKNQAGVIFTVGRDGGTDARPFYNRTLDTKAMSKPGYINKLANKKLSAASKAGIDVIYEGLASSLNETKGTNVPPQFAKDFYRSSGGITMPDGTNLNPHEGYKDIQVFYDRFAEKMTKGRVKHYNDLTDRDLKLVQFAMASLNQRMISPLSCLEQMIVKDDSRMLLVTNQKVGYKVSVNDDGSMTFTSYTHSHVTQVTDGNKIEIKTDSTKSDVGISCEITYSAETIDNILAHDWNDPSVDWVKGDNREFYFTCHLEE